MKSSRRAVGRPSKGERRYVNTPVPAAAARKLERYAELTGESMGPTLARIFEDHIDDLKLDELEEEAAARTGQERLQIVDRQTA